MDPDICRWILEFLLRSSIPDSIVKKIMKALPLSNINSRLRKTIVLRDMQSEVATTSLTENLLVCLEVIEEINRLDGIAISAAMKEAYCAVAVECTVKYLDACPDKNTCGLFDDAVNRIWRGRVRQMMEAVASGKKIDLFTAELIGWKDVIESARWDREVCERLTNMNTRQNAFNKVRVYLKETWASMGPAFLEQAAILSEDKGWGNSWGDKMGDIRGELADCIPNGGCDNGVSESVLVSDQMNRCKGRLHYSTNMTEKGLVVFDGNALYTAATCMEKTLVAGGNQVFEQLGKRAVSSVGGSQALGGIDLPRRINKEIEKVKLPLEHNHGAPRIRRGVNISDAEEAKSSTVCSKDHNASNIQVDKLRKSLISSSLELRALVKDPLPDALHRSDIVRSELASKGVNHEPSFENQSAVVDVPEQNTCRSMVLYQPIDILKKQYSANCSNVQRPSLMERNSTACTYEWDDSFIDVPGRSPKKRRRKGRWGSEEEDALRAGVKKFGKGNWKSILRFYSEIFTKTGRTEVDLKDKWRNLTR
ncbi:uncharacterized protein LOC129285980 [Prosopis cineraria]|uniref:uncharacterized protein LOC129285243 n=1 Tax=Prosopis cineraria TaxID=364024 RepID=UPI00240FF328|nr:uncharacterized protein LOC129285243 [Prosopis cineraria]XP_054777976.1 uncharacterized protein LOC129285980 [Prosopis cineraria]